MEQKLLSISIMTNGSDPMMPESLKAAAQLRDALQGELVIVDTGCDIENRTFIEQYANLVVDYQWNDDFASARNAGLTQCTGKWFLYLDDDEVLADWQPLADFLRDEESLKYGTGKIQIRNYTNERKTEYKDSYVLRLSQRLPDLFFEDRVHEHLCRTYHPIAVLNARVDHYGYIFQNQEQRYQHAQRNIRLLNLVLEEKKDDCFAGMQLVQEYCSVQENFRAQRLSRHYLDLLENQRESGTVEYRSVFAAAFAAASYNLSDYSACIQMAEKANEHTDLYSHPALRTLAMWATFAAWEKKQIDQTIHYGELYRQTLSEEKKDRESVAGVLFVEEGFTEGKQELLFQILLMAAMEKQDFRLMESCQEKLDWRNPSFAFQMDFPKILCQYLLRTDAPELIRELPGKISGNEKLQTQLFQTILQLWDYDNYKNAYGSILTAIDADHPYLYMARIFTCDDTAKGQEQRIHDYKCLFQTGTTIFEWPDSLWSDALDHQIPIEAFTMEQPLTQFVKAAKKKFNNADAEELLKWDGYQSRIHLQENAFNDYACMVGIMRYMKLNPNPEAYEELYGFLQIFSQCAMQYYDNVYTFEAFSDEKFLCDEARLAKILTLFFIYEGDGDYKNALGTLRSGLGIRPDYDDLLQNFAHRYAEKLLAE